MSKLTTVICITALMLLPVRATFGNSVLQVSPLRLEFSQAQTHTTLTVKNRGTSGSLVQLEVFRWTQKNGEDVLEPSRDVLVSPPVFKIGAGGEQVIRALVRKSPDDKREITYRILIREVADEVSTDVDHEAVKVLLGFSLPVFIKSNHETQQSMTWRAAKSGDNKLKLSLQNQGDKHVQVTAIDIQNDKGKTITKIPNMAYVLPDNQREWLLDLADPETSPTINLVAKTDNGELREVLALERP